MLQGNVVSVTAGVSKAHFYLKMECFCIQHHINSLFSAYFHAIIIWLIVERKSLNLVK